MPCKADAQQARSVQRNCKHLAPSQSLLCCDLPIFPFWLRHVLQAREEGVDSLLLVHLFAATLNTLSCGPRAGLARAWPLNHRHRPPAQAWLLRAKQTLKMALPRAPNLLRARITLRMARPKAPKLLRGVQTIRMARPKTPQLLLCKDTLRMALPKALKLLRCAITLRMGLAKSHKLLLWPSTGSMVLVEAPEQGWLQQRLAREGRCVPTRTAPPLMVLL